MIGQIHKIQLVFPPLSNQSAEWLKDIDQIHDMLSSSKLYAIGQREEVFFEFDNNTCFDKKRRMVNGKLVSGKLSDSFSIDMKELFKFYPSYFDSLDEVDLRAGPKIIKLWSDKENDFINWWTVEKLVYDRSVGFSFIKGLDNYRLFSKYHIHYIGISLENDSLTRLVIKPHDKRLRILSNEWPLREGSRLTDEIVLFFFDVHTSEINTYDINNPDLFINSLYSITGTKTNIIADAEKALVKILNSEYNEVKFQNYPVSKDGLWKFPIDRMAYFIGDSYEFITQETSIVGNYTTEDIDPENKSDFIFIDRGNVQLIKVEKDV